MKENKNRILDLSLSFKKGVKHIFQITAYVTLVGNILDILTFTGVNSWVIIHSMFLDFFILSLLIMYYTKKIHYKLGFTILIYIITENIFAVNLSIPDDFENSVLVNLFLRDSLFVIFLLTLASFSLHKLHSVIIGTSYLVFCIIFSKLVKNDFLNESIGIIIFIVIAYVALIYYLVSMFEKALLNQQEKNLIIQDQNTTLNEINMLLEEQQQKVEMQAEELEIKSNAIRKQSDELKTINKELKKTNASKDMLFSIIAHDLKNPFNVILGYTELLKTKFNSLSKEKKIRYVDIIGSNSNNVYHLLEDLLQWARSQTNSLMYNPQPVSLNAIIEEALELYNENIKKKSINIEYSPHKTYTIYADKDMIGTVVRNLISNAIKFTFEKGKIVISLKEEEGKVECTIVDNGVGVNPDVIQRLFDIDRHLSTKGTSGEKGSGLGLVLTKTFLEKNMGQVKVTSEKGKGSSFTFVLPKGK